MVSFRGSTTNILRACAAVLDRPVVIVLPVTLLLFFGRTAFSSNTFFFRDLQLLFYPMKFFLGESLRKGFLPYWCSNHSCGAPFLGDIQAGVFYPLSWIFVLPLPYAFTWYVLVHLVLGFLFCYLFLTEIEASPRAATLAAVSFCYGGYTIATINTLNNLSTVIWLPAILWARRRAFRYGTGRYYLLTIFFLSLAFLGGEPQLFVLSAGLLLLHSPTLLRGLSAGPAAYLRLFLTDAALLSSVALITLPQIGPTYTYYQHSARYGGIPYAAAAEYSLNWGMLKHLLIPLRFPSTFTVDPSTLRTFFPGGSAVPWLMTVYPGFLAALLAAGGFLSLIRRRRFFWPIVTAISLVLALGSHTPAFLLFYKILPVFRYPAKFMFPAGFALLIMASVGYDSLAIQVRRRGLSPTILFLAAISVLTLDLWYNHRYLNPVWAAQTYERHHPDLDVILGDKSTFRVFVDTDAFNRLRPDDSIRTIQDRWQAYLAPDTGLLQGLAYVNGISGLELRSQYLITEQLAKPWPEKIRFLQLANVKYIVSPENLELVPGLEDRIVRRNQVVYQVLNPLPRAWMAGRIAPVPKETTAKFLRGKVDDLTNGFFDPATTVLAWTAEPSGAPAFEPVREMHYNPDGSIVLQTTVEQPGILVLSESWYPGWKVLVDGRPTDPLCVDLLFLGVRLGPGAHHLTFLYRPRHFSLFLAIAAAGLVLLIVTVPRLAPRIRNS